MFEFIRHLEVDPDRAVAVGRAQIPSHHPLLRDHFPGQELMPGSLLVELCAQTGGILAEDVAARRLGLVRWAMLGMIRRATFLAPVALPATIRIEARATRWDATNVQLGASVIQDDRCVARCDLVMALAEVSPTDTVAIEARNERLRLWTGT